jgi:hypothetical protein
MPVGLLAANKNPKNSSKFSASFHYESKNWKIKNNRTSFYLEIFTQQQQLCGLEFYADKAVCKELADLFDMMSESEWPL